MKKRKLLSPGRRRLVYARLCYKAAIFLLMLLPVVTLKAQPVLSSISFSQYDRYSLTGGLLFSNSSLGTISFSAYPDKTKIYYLNVYAKNRTNTSNVWLVENYPVLANDNVPAVLCDEVSIDYKLLDYTPGQQVNYVSYNYTITPSIVPSIAISTDTISTDVDTHDPRHGDRPVYDNPVYTNARVNSQSMSLALSTPATVSKKQYRNENSGFFNETANFVRFKIDKAVTDTIKHDSVPGVDEAFDQCLPGSFARSIAWLNKKYNLGLTITAQNIYDTLAAFDIPVRLSYDSFVARKAAYLKSISGGKGRTTKVPAPASVCGFLKDSMPKCDVELEFAWPNGKTHIVTVTAVISDGSGCCTIKYRDDTKQDSAGGDECEKSAKVCGDSIEIDGKKNKVKNLISECIDPPARLLPSKEQPTVPDLVLLQNAPNPFGGITTISFTAKNAARYKNVFITVRNEKGRELKRLTVNIHDGTNEIKFRPESNLKGVLYYSLEADGVIIGTRKMMIVPGS